jgi:hypothetical protein
MRLRSKILWSVCAAAVIGAAGLAFYTVAVYRSGVKAGRAPENPSAVKLIFPSAGPVIGSEVTAESFIKCPWHRRPEEVTAEAGKGLQLIGKPSASLAKVRNGWNIWRISAVFQPCRSGEAGPGSIQLKVAGSGSDSKTLEYKMPVPGFNVPVMKVDSEALTLASKIDIIKNNFWVKLGIIAAAVVILALAALWFRLRGAQKAKIPVIPPWAMALSELGELKRKLAGKAISCEFCFAGLTDVVRMYLEKRFRIRAAEQTTYEFLEELRRPESPLQEGHRRFLSEFMSAADLVKFAKLPADAHLVDSALDKAEKLVLETKPAEERKTEK